MRVKFTEEMYGRIPAMVKAGMRREEIAGELGTSVGSLQVQCSKQGISLRRPGRQRMTLKSKEVPLSLDELKALRRQARSMGKDEAQLAAELLRVIVKDGLFKAVLDEELQNA
jgi:hypothetical protein